MPRYQRLSQYLIPVPEVLSDNPSLQEILWYFSRYTDQKQHLTLRENPHFYAELPTSPEEYGDSLRIDPTEDFQHANKFYVLIDKPELVHIATDRVSQCFGSFWCPKNAIIFKGLGVFFVFLRVFEVFPDVCGRLRGETIIKASLSGTCCRFCKQIPVPTVPRASRNRRGLQPIITEGCSRTGWKCSTGCLPVHSSDNIGFRICVGRVTPDNPVCCDVITYLTVSANTDIAPGSLTTYVRAAGVQRGIQNVYPYAR